MEVGLGHPLLLSLSGTNKRCVLCERGREHTNCTANYLLDRPITQSEGDIARTNALFLAQLNLFVDLLCTDGSHAMVKGTDEAYASLGAANRVEKQEDMPHHKRRTAKKICNAGPAEGAGWQDEG
ncbi:PREDICTED: uncharacterized protein LOC106810313 [Priapulus caudatus]|uniref:Uncharacterized protein LOC106810313 n=1 Tax=Priapulus caudatus TaxID=37621 RepID=A0ABM1EA86_PRICU|nr:PREDICTED: uncharacterized protein LOC106810313 [Priapulus caudatus]